MNQLVIDNGSEVSIKNKDVLICINCGSTQIDSHEFGISCEDCGALIWREKC